MPMEESPEKYKTDCFAFRKNEYRVKCDALKVIDCKNCVFYKTMEQFEAELKCEDKYGTD